MRPRRSLSPPKTAHLCCREVLKSGFFMGLAALLVSTTSTQAADPPEPKLALSFRPSRPHVEYDIPTAAEIPKCTVRVERHGDVSGWMVLGPNGQILRRFLDTDGDNIVDQWRYFHNGMEVYRDLDTNANQKSDQFRFVNQGGSRWGIDANEDGKVDSWKILSAEEASQVAVQAILNRNAALLETVLINEQDIKELGIQKEIAATLLKAVANPAEQLAQVVEGSQVLAPSSSWIKLDSSTPGIIPADAGKANQDLSVRENAVAIIDLGDKTGLAQVGELVRVGQVWKLTQIPRPIEGDNMQIASGGLLLRPVALNPTGGVPGGISDEMRTLLESLQQLDSKAPAPADGVEAFAKYNAARAEILAGLIDASQTAQDKELWTRQFADSVSAAVATGSYPEGLKKLTAVEQQLDENDALRAYVQYRRLFATYQKRSRQAEGEEQIEIQGWWEDNLQQFVTAFPKSPDAAEALLQLALAEELSGNLDEAANWYQQLVGTHKESPQAARAQGALHRLGLKGKVFEFSAARLQGEGKISVADLRGKLVLVLFWSTTCQPCEQDLPLLKSLYDQYHAQGFEILGVNLDPTTQNVAAYIKEHKMPWPQVHEDGGRQSGPAKQFGIITLPTMILVGQDGKVISRGTSAEDLKTALPKLLKGE